MTGTNGRFMPTARNAGLSRATSEALPDYGKGWNVRYTTELTARRGFYLRGEEYGAQIDEFVDAVRAGGNGTPNDFASAAVTDQTIALLLADRGDSGTARCGPHPSPWRGARGSDASGERDETLDRLLFGDNQFFGINHMSEEKARAQAMRFQDTAAIIACSTPPMTKACAPSCARPTTGSARSATTSAPTRPATLASVLSLHALRAQIRQRRNRARDARRGMHFMPDDGLFKTALRGACRLARKDVEGMMKILVDMEMKMFRGLKTPVIFLQNVVVDLMLGMGMDEIFPIFARLRPQEVRRRAGLHHDEHAAACSTRSTNVGIENPIVCANINKIGFRISWWTRRLYRASAHRPLRAIAMSVFASGAIPPREAIEWVANLPNIDAIVFGASSRQNIRSTKVLVDEFFGRPASSSGGMNTSKGRIEAYNGGLLGLATVERT